MINVVNGKQRQGLKIAPVTFWKFQYEPFEENCVSSRKHVFNVA